MLTLNLKDFKIDINNYNNYVANLEVKTLVCPNCKACDFERHGYYKRYINISGTKYYIRILRVFYKGFLYNFRCFFLKYLNKKDDIFKAFFMYYLLSA